MTGRFMWKSTREVAIAGDTLAYASQEITFPSGRFQPVIVRTAAGYDTDLEKASIREQLLMNEIHERVEVDFAAFLKTRFEVIDGEIV